MDWHHEIIFVLSNKTYYIQNISVLLLAVLFLYSFEIWSDAEEICVNSAKQT
jgi:hypothetical protein